MPQYTPPTNGVVNFELQSYTPPTNGVVNFSMEEGTSVPSNSINTRISTTRIVISNVGSRIFITK